MPQLHRKWERTGAGVRESAGRRVTKRATIADIAQRAGAVQGRRLLRPQRAARSPGVDPPAGAQAGRQLSWRPNSAAGRCRRPRAGALGLVMARPASTLGVEPFFITLISGIENTLAAHSTALVLQVVADRDAEVEAYHRRWWAERRSTTSSDRPPGRCGCWCWRSWACPRWSSAGPATTAASPRCGATTPAPWPWWSSTWPPSATAASPGSPGRRDCSTPSCAARPSARSRPASNSPRR